MIVLILGLTVCLFVAAFAVLAQVSSEAEPVRPLDRDTFDSGGWRRLLKSERLRLCEERVQCWNRTAAALNSYLAFVLVLVTCAGALLLLGVTKLRERYLGASTFEYKPRSVVTDEIVRFR